MTWYERARERERARSRAFTFPESNPESGSGLEERATDHRESPQQTPPHLIRSATAPAGQTVLVQETVNNYNLDWIELRPFLVKKYPQIIFPERQSGTQDHFVFTVPQNQLLTDEDRDKIEEIRAEHRARVNPDLKKPRQEHSPDPPLRRLEEEEEEDDIE